MSDISALYEEVMAGAAETEKVAGAGEGPDFGPEFFEKVAAGDEASVTVLNDFIENAKAVGHSEDEIEAAIVQVMSDTGIEIDDTVTDGGFEEDSEFEQQKAAAYFEGAEQAIEDALESDFAKEAGISGDDLMEFEVGGQYGEGYAQMRSVVDNAIIKIAQTKIEKEAEGRIDAIKAGLGKALGKARDAGKTVGQGYQDLSYMAMNPRDAASALKQSIKEQGVKGTMRGNVPALAALGTTAAGGTAAAGGTYAAMKGRKK